MKKAWGAGFSKREFEKEIPSTYKLFSNCYFSSIFCRHLVNVVTAVIKNFVKKF